MRIESNSTEAKELHWCEWEKNQLHWLKLLRPPKESNQSNCGQPISRIEFRKPETEKRRLKRKDPNLGLAKKRKMKNSRKMVNGKGQKITFHFYKILPHPKLSIENPEWLCLPFCLTGYMQGAQQLLSCVLLWRKSAIFIFQTADAFCVLLHIVLDLLRLRATECEAYLASVGHCNVSCPVFR